MTLRILSFDPGLTTGVAYAEVDPTSGKIEFKEFAQETYDRRFGLQQFITMYQPHVVLVERFLLYNHKKDSQVNSIFETVRVIGILEAATHLSHARRGLPYHWVEQNASVMSRVEVLREHEPFLKGKRHAMAAYMHIRYFVVDNKANLHRFTLPGNGPPL